jgi:hypothetical protein
MAGGELDPQALALARCNVFYFAHLFEPMLRYPALGNRKRIALETSVLNTTSSCTPLSLTSQVTARPFEPRFVCSGIEWELVSPPQAVTSFPRAACRAKQAVMAVPRAGIRQNAGVQS